MTPLNINALIVEDNRAWQQILSEILTDSGLELSRGGAIEVGDDLRASLPDVWAAGDCAEVRHVVTGALNKQIAACLGIAEKTVKNYVSNLLANVRTHTPEGTHVTIDVARRNGKVQLSVADDGPGIATTDRDQLFGLAATIAKELEEKDLAKTVYAKAEEKITGVRTFVEGDRLVVEAAGSDADRVRELLGG